MTDSDDQRATIAFLARPESYGLKEPVERIDTHAAIVFLAGDYAFKLKRAVRYPYLDFSTAARRRDVCEAELKLNRRTAPELYLEVRSVNRLPDGSLGFDDGDPVDWLVVMRRFDSDKLLESVASRGDLTPGLVRDLADHIAAFHDRAEVVSARNGSARLRRVIDGNRESMLELPGSIFAPPDIENLHTRSVAALDRVSELLDRRALDGRVRHCHGDMHLANICIWQGRPTLFDCLEFDDELATTDVLYDLAFLLMDLWQRGYRAEASQLFNRYLDRRDEADGLAAITLMLSARSAVRAHVSATSANRQATPQQRCAKLASARDYLDAALSFLEQPGPRLIAIGGLSGTGKSTLASSLAPEIGAPPGARWLRSDVIRKSLAGCLPEERLPPDAYKPERSADVYEHLVDKARESLAAGRAVVVDAVFARTGERKQISEIAEKASVPFLGLWLDAPLQTLLARVDARNGDASDADKAVVRQQANYEIDDLAGWTILAADGDPADVLANARRIVLS